MAQGKSVMCAMTLTRRAGESLQIGDDIEVRVLEVKGDRVRIGVTAPRRLWVPREELVARQLERDALPFRSSRFYSRGAKWYVATREKQRLGPFRSRDEAKMAVAAYVANQATAETHGASSIVSMEPDSIAARLQELREFIRVRERQGMAVARVWAKDRIKRLEDESLSPAEHQERAAALEYLIQTDSTSRPRLGGGILPARAPQTY